MKYHPTSKVMIRYDYRRQIPEATLYDAEQWCLRFLEGQDWEIENVGGRFFAHIRGI